MRIVDVSTMLGPWALTKLEFSDAKSLVQKMDHYGIDEAFAYSSYAVRVSPLDGNYMLAEQIKGYEDRIHPVWDVLPTWDIECERPLEGELKKHGVKMVRMFPNNHALSLDVWACEKLYGMLQSKRIPLLLNGPDVTLGQLHAIATQFPQLPLILTQCDYNQNRALYALLEKHENVYLEIATYYIYDGIEDIVKNFGAKRMIFGSRMPFQEGAAALGMTMLADISEADRNLILAGNIDALLKEVAL